LEFDRHELNQLAAKAREMREQGELYNEIAKVVGVSKSSVVNYLKGYPYGS
jgi:predicted transcriptional regulator